MCDWKAMHLFLVEVLDVVGGFCGEEDDGLRWWWWWFSL